MPDEQILELASKYFELHLTEAGGSVWYEWSGKPEDLLKFALLIHENGYNKGYDDSKSSSFKGFHTCLDD